MQDAWMPEPRAEQRERAESDVVEAALGEERKGAQRASKGSRRIAGLHALRKWCGRKSTWTSGAENSRTMPCASATVVLGFVADGAAGALKIHAEA
ncbi:hypothetical protein BT63DRAFT_452190 [Microthyrium microscopicum]|uniref:Uncharacterized protein n=1 Tax=Microthyrium microscopicum TaxID=703497 RepID=A0A6A6UJ08_9PEZI|nr:hypothetical protein BT63DRAFT_452190 [Microthyrium microscopicum]